ncbi:MAG: calcium/sodium antiporter [Clostridia bacterium]|nr:calcium/sodium antiporter [Clostridia bacterium]
MEYLLLAICLVSGFILLIKGADFFVDGASSVAKMLRVPPLIIGMTIVAMGTSLPECAVSVTASISNSNGLAIGNAIGSNIFNLMVVCGFCVLFVPLEIEKGTLLKEFPFSVVIALLLLVFGLVGESVNRIEGVILLTLFVLFLLYMIFSAKKQAKTMIVAEDEEKPLPVWKAILCIVFGAAAIMVGGDLVVDSATRIASLLHMTDTLIGLTVVACGTSLPELVTSVVAARKKQLDMALGNVIGSNIFNILFVLGIAVTISPLAFTTENAIDIAILCGMSALVWLFTFKKKKLVRWQGVVMLLLYVAYLAYIIARVYA